MCAFLEKLTIFSNRVLQNNFANFPHMDALIMEGKLVPFIIKEQIIEHLKILKTSFDKYFGAGEFKTEVWIENPFIVDFSSMSDEDEAKEEFAELRACSLLKSKQQTESLEEFWCSRLEEFPILTNRAMKVMIPFVTTYVCEAGFSTMLNIKNKNRNRLDIMHDMRVALSITKPRFDDMIKPKQQQRSH